MMPLLKKSAALVVLASFSLQIMAPTLHASGVFQDTELQKKTLSPSRTSLENLKQSKAARLAVARRMAVELGLVDSTGATSSSSAGGRFAALVYGYTATAEHSTAQKEEAPQKPPVNHKGPQFKLSDFLTIDKVQLSTLALVQLMLPAQTTSIDLPINISGRLEITREGEHFGKQDAELFSANVSTLQALRALKRTNHPLRVQSNLIARKGVALTMPLSRVAIGEEKGSTLPVKIQAEDGSISIISKSLDLIKAQLFGRTGIHLEVEENPLHIGRHVESKIVVGVLYHADRGYAAKIEFKANQVPPETPKTYNFPRMDEHFYFEPILPYKRSNGTYLMTEGTLTMIAPGGVKIDQAEIDVRGGDWKLSGGANAPLINEGGKICINGNAEFSGVKVHNTILSAVTDWLNVAWHSTNLLYPTTQRSEMRVGGDLIADSLENLGSFVHVGGKLVERCVDPKQDFNYVMTLCDTRYNLYITPEYRSIVSFGKGASFPEAKNPVLEGVIQGCLMAMCYEGEARVGRYENYRRPTAIRAFKQLQDFDLDRASALFIPNDDRSIQWMHKPAVPLTWDIQLPPAVGIGKSGLYLVDGPLLYHPLQEIDGLANVFSEQLKRGYLDGKNTQSQATYIKGRYAAYDFYLKHFGPKVIGAVPAPELPQNALALADNIDFMVLYRAAADCGTTVHTPVSCLSSRYDDPQVRNLDGGIFVDKLHMTGAPGSSLRILSTVHGDKELTLTGPHIAVERQVSSWLTYHTNVTKKKRFLGCSESEETVAILNTESQPHTGLLSTGKGGKATITADVLEHKNGAQMRIGSEGLDVQIGKVIMGPGVDTSVGYSESRSGRNSAFRYFPVHNILPASIISEGGVRGNVGDLEFRGSNLVALDKDIRLNITGDAALLTYKLQQSLGAVVSKNGGAVTVSEGTTEVALPSSLIALNGGVYLSVGGTMHGSAPQFYGKKVDVMAKKINVPIEPIKTQIFTKTTGFTSWTTHVNRSIFETHEHALHPSIVTQDGSIFRATDGPAYVEAPLLSGDYTQSAVGGDSILGSASLRHTRDEESTTISLTNPAISFAESVLQGDFGSVLKTIQNQFPLLATIQQLVRANDGASFAEGAMKTLYQTHQFMSSLKSAGSVSRYFQDRMMRVGVGIQDSESRAIWTTAAVSHVLTPSHITLTSVGGSTRTVGLSGTLSNLTMRSDKDLIIEPPLESGESSTSTDGMEISFGFTKDGGSVTMGGSGGSSQAHYKTYAHQPLNVLGLTSLIADGDIYLSTPFTTARSFMDGRQIIATTLQDSQSSSHESFSGSLGISYGAAGVTPSGSFTVAMGHGYSLRTPHPTIITSTTSSEIRAREKVVLKGASFISHGPGIFASPLTEVYDVVNHTHSENTRFGGEFSGSGSVPGFMEMGFESLNQSARHRPTISPTYAVQGSVGAANRDAALMYEEGPTDRTHLWFGAPLVANTYEALADMCGGLNVLGQAFSSASNPVPPQRIFTEEAFDDFDEGPMADSHEADYFEDDFFEAQSMDFNDQIEMKPTPKKRTPTRKDALAEQAHDLILDSLYLTSDTQMDFLFSAAESLVAAERAERTPMRKFTRKDILSEQVYDRIVDSRYVLNDILADQTHDLFMSSLHSLSDNQMRVLFTAAVERLVPPKKVTIMASGAEFIYPATEEITQADFVTRAQNHAAAARGIWLGAKDAVHGLVGLIAHPYDNLIAPVGRVLWDVNVVAAGLNKRAGVSIPHWDQPFSQDYYPDAATYSTSRNRLRNIWHGIKNQVHAISNANAADQIETGFRVASSLLTPWAVVKGVGTLPKLFTSADYLSDIPMSQFHSGKSIALNDSVPRTTNFQGRRSAYKSQIPFVNKLDDLIHQPDDIKFSHLLLLGEQAGSLYKGNSRTSFCYDGTFLNNVRIGAGKWIHDPKGPYVISAHGSEHGIDLSRMVAELPKKLVLFESLDLLPLSYSLEAFPVSHRFLGKMILRDPAFDKSKLVVALSCDVGKADYAQNLANYVGASVIAPSERIWAGSEGHLIVAKAEAGSNLLDKDLNNWGQFRLFHPGNRPAPMHSMQGVRDPIIIDGQFHPGDSLSKRVKAMRNNPKGDYKISDLQYVAFRYGIEYRQNSTSHVTFTYPNTRPVVVPSRKSIHTVYIKQIMAMLDDVIAKK